MLGRFKSLVNGLGQIGFRHGNENTWAVLESFRRGQLVEVKPNDSLERERRIGFSGRTYAQPSSVAKVWVQQ